MKYGRTLYWVDTITDFLIKLGIKPRKNLLEISIFSLNDVIIRPTKNIYEQPPQRLQNSAFQSSFSASKINQIFLIFFSMKNIRLEDQLLKLKIF